MRIAICEDNPNHSEILQNMIQKWAEKADKKIELCNFQSAEQFLFHMRDGVHYNLAFLDIQMGKMNGMQLAKRIREEDSSMFLVFTTGLLSYALRGYEVAAFRYLIKPIKEADVELVLNETSRILDEQEREAVIVSANGELKRVLKREIHYIEMDDHYIVIHTKNEKIRFKEKLKNFEIQFSEPEFVKCHRSCIVNLRYVTKISKDGVEMEDGAVLSVSRGQWEKLNQNYMKYYMK